MKILYVVLLVLFSPAAFAADLTVKMSARVDYKACIGHPDDPQSVCSGTWLGLEPIEIGMMEETDVGPLLADVFHGSAFFNPVINGITFHGQLQVEKWTVKDKTRWYIEAKIGTSLDSPTAAETDLYVDTLEELNQINLFGPWVKHGDHYARPILRVGPALK